MSWLVLAGILASKSPYCWIHAWDQDGDGSMYFTFPMNKAFANMSRLILLTPALGGHHSVHVSSGYELLRAWTVTNCQISVRTESTISCPYCFWS